MAWRLFLRISSVLLLILVAFDLATLPRVAAQQQPAFIGTWGVAGPDGNGGQNDTWITFAANGQYQAVTATQGGPNNGSVIQRWGTYQSRATGPNAYEVAVKVTGGAPSQLCMAGTGCRPVQGIQSQFQASFQIVGNQMRMANGSTPMQRTTVPQQLQARLPATRTLAPPPPARTGSSAGTTGGSKGSATKIPGLGNNCDNAQQNRICTVNGGRMYTDNRGCQVCAGP